MSHVEYHLVDNGGGGEGGAVAEFGDYDGDGDGDGDGDQCRCDLCPVSLPVQCPCLLWYWHCSP